MMLYGGGWIRVNEFASLNSICTTYYSKRQEAVPDIVELAIVFVRCICPEIFKLLEKEYQICQFALLGGKASH